MSEWKTLARGRAESRPASPRLVDKGPACLMPVPAPSPQPPAPSSVRPLHLVGASSRGQGPDHLSLQGPGPPGMLPGARPGLSAPSALAHAPPGPPR